MGKQVEHNPNMQQGWELIILHPPKTSDVNEIKNYTDTLEDAKDWCGKNTHGRWTFGRELVRDRLGSIYYTTAFRFKGKRDAMIFKLTFG